MKQVDCDCEDSTRVLDRTSDGISKHVKRHFWYLLAITILCETVAMLMLFVVYPKVQNDLQRWLVDGTVRAGFCFPLTLWPMWFIEFITNGNLLKRALENPLAAASVIIGYGYIAMRLVLGV